MSYARLNSKQKNGYNFFVSIWNLRNRQNVASYYWDKKRNEQDALYQWGRLPVLGLEYDF